MCGICGAVDFSGAVNAAEVVRRMTPTMQHRGPDDEGYLDRGSLSLGMRRLSIIDLEGGHQPIFNEDGKIGVVLNGEIYNFQQLQQQMMMQQQAQPGAEGGAAPPPATAPAPAPAPQ